MFTLDFRITAIASLALAVAVWSPSAVHSRETTSEPARAAIKHSLSAFAIGEEKVGKKTFIISETIVKATPVRVWDVLTDYDNAANIFSNVITSKLLSSSGSTKLVSFSIRTAGNLLKFDYTLELTEKRPSLLEWKRASGAFRANEGYWKLEPLQNGQATLVTYAKYIDGGFFFPQAFVKKSLRDAVPAIFADLTNAAESPQVAASEP